MSAEKLDPCIGYPWLGFLIFRWKLFLLFLSLLECGWHLSSSEPEFRTAFIALVEFSGLNPHASLTQNPCPHNYFFPNHCSDLVLPSCFSLSNKVQENRLSPQSWAQFFVSSTQPTGSQFPQPGIEPVLLQWKCRFLTTGPSGKSLDTFLIRHVKYTTRWWAENIFLKLLWISRLML